MDEWVSEYRKNYKQDMTEGMCLGLIGKDIRCVGTVPNGNGGRREIGYEATIVGYENGVLVAPDGTRAYRWSLLTDEGLSCPLWKDATWQILEGTTHEHTGS